MPKLTGIFEELAGLESLPIDEINNFLSPQEHFYVLENYLGNRILYPQTIPQSKRDMEIDTAILCAYMHTHQDLFINNGLRRVVISEKIETRFPPLANLIFYFPNIFHLESTVTIAVQREIGQIEVVGTIVTPSETLNKIKINGQEVNLNPEGMTYIESHEKNNEVELSNQVLTVEGGKLGIVINQKGGKGESSSKSKA